MEQDVFKYPFTFPLENGKSLPEIEIAYFTAGKLNDNQDNVIWVCHALTANAVVSDWWSGLYGEGKLLDPSKYFIVCANMLSSCYGSTNALSVNPETHQPYFHKFPLVTVRDMVNGLDLLRKHLKINKIKLVLGGSMGGQQALEWMIMKPEVFENAFLIATNARHSAWGIAFNESQRMAIEADASWKTSSPEAGMAGMRAARAMALLSYRNYEAYYHTQTDKNADKFDGFSASSYQQYQGDKLQKRFHAFSYWSLTKAMDSHNVGRNRGGVEAALQKVQARTLVVGIDSDVLFPPAEQRFLAENIRNAAYAEIGSIYGHDGFLIENDKITQLVQQYELLESPAKQKKLRAGFVINDEKKLSA